MRSRTRSCAAAWGCCWNQPYFPARTSSAAASSTPPPGAAATATRPQDEQTMSFSRRTRARLIDTSSRRAAALVAPKEAECVYFDTPGVRLDAGTSAHHVLTEELSALVRGWHANARNVLKELCHHHPPITCFTLEEAMVVILKTGGTVH
jgi:hypothetical protein